MPNPLLAAKQISHSFQDGDRHAYVLDQLNLSVNAGEAIALVGSSGCGKTTLLHILSGLAQPSQGRVIFNGQPLNADNANAMATLFQHDIGFIYQFHHLLPEFSALDNVALPLIIQGHTSSKACQAAEKLLATLDIKHCATQSVAQLSGGERQRVAIARAIIHQPKILFADEPTGNLDPEHGQQISELLVALNQQHGMSLVVATHDQLLASRLQHCWCLEKGQLHAN